ncbi:16S rRNA (cytosine(1402)-N(4))-methyltransferase RsmH [Patescibacteria group bacterium]|nr:16S rRNA (cytosine(1402)-N(4))-methyltransferase RsmH [Patescibacteria group bacterium]
MHKSVLLQETIEHLQLTKGDLVIDATCGAGGHTKEMARLVGSSGKVLAIDRDENALDLARSVFRGENVTFIHGEMANIEKIALKNNFKNVAAIMADLGVSSMQFDQPARGFSLKSRGVLDMRMDQGSELDALTVVNTYSEDQLARIFRLYGEEKKSRLVARAIVEARKESRIRRTDQLAEVVRGVIRARRARRNRNSKFEFQNSGVDPATKVFQAIRIEVNQELNQLELALPQMVSLLRPGGRLAIISFHSLEDRIVKEFFRDSAKDCVCPPEFPKCLCNHPKTLRLITKKPITPTEQEITSNTRSRSAKLRVAEKV